MTTAVQTYSVEEAAHLLSVSRSHVYRLVGRRQLPAVRLGRRLVLPRRGVARLLRGEPVLAHDTRNGAGLVENLEEEVQDGQS